MIARWLNALLTKVVFIYRSMIVEKGSDHSLEDRPSIFYLSNRKQKLRIMFKVFAIAESYMLHALINNMV